MKMTLSFSVVFLMVLCLAYAEHVTLKSFSEKEVECLKQEKLLYKNECYELKKTGPCPTGEWLVLDKQKLGKENTKNLLQPMCKKPPCEGVQIYYWAKTKECIKQRDKVKVCGNMEGIDLTNSVFGDGECACKADHARQLGDEQGPCYPLYHRGPCVYGMIFGCPTVNYTQSGQCIPDACHEETIRRKREKLMKEDGVLATWYDGKCHELGTQGPCQPPATFRVHSTLKTPECISPGNVIFGFGRPDNCYADQGGNCQTVVEFKNPELGAEKYMESLFSSANSLRKK